MDDPPPKKKTGVEEAYKDKKDCWHEDFFNLKTNDLPHRSPYSRDRDRIVFSSDFRRLEGKAQVYSPDKSDHIRTRLTHTIEVAKIAQNIGTYLNAKIKNKLKDENNKDNSIKLLNLDLIEAIAFGHDVGHAPFGHQGERVLDSILNGERTFHNKWEYRINYGGFKHNFMSIKILDMYSQKYLHSDAGGLNLSPEVLEGILKHTQIYRKRGDKEEKQKNDNESKEKDWRDKEKDWDLYRYKHKHTPLDIFSLKYHFSITIEGQIVYIADEIAQRQHDIDDAVRDESYEISIDNILRQLIEEFEKIFQDCESCSDSEIESLMDYYCCSACDRQDPAFPRKSVLCFDSIESEILSRMKYLECCVKDETFKKLCFVRDIVEYFIQKTVCEAFRKIDAEGYFWYFKEKNGRRVEKKIVVFPTEAKKLNKCLLKLINNKIINSYEVSRFDGKSAFTIRRLFKAYFVNPRQMQSSHLRSLSKKINGYLECLDKGVSREEMHYYERGLVSIDDYDKKRNDACFFRGKLKKDGLFYSQDQGGGYVDFNFTGNKSKSVNLIIKLLKLDKDTINKMEFLYYPHQNIFSSDTVYNSILEQEGRLNLNKESNKVIYEELGLVLNFCNEYKEEEEQKKQLIDYFFALLRLSDQIHKQEYRHDRIANFNWIDFHEISDCIYGNKKRCVNAKRCNSEKRCINPSRYVKRYLMEMTFLLLCNYEYISTICDYIARMTDTYAKKEYEALYQV